MITSWIAKKCNSGNDLDDPEYIASNRKYGRGVSRWSGDRWEIDFFAKQRRDRRTRGSTHSQKSALPGIQLITKFSSNKKTRKNKKNPTTYYSFIFQIPKSFQKDISSKKKKIELSKPVPEGTVFGETNPIFLFLTAIIYFRWFVVGLCVFEVNKNNKTLILSQFRLIF